MSNARPNFTSSRLLLLDGPLYDKHSDVIARMADDLVRFEATQDDQTAIRALMGRYAYGQIVVLLDDARAQALAQEMAERIRDQGVRPELSVYNDAMLQGALGLIARGAVLAPACFGLILKEPAGMAQGAQHLIRLAQSLPAQSQWWFAKGGRHGLGLRSLAIELGGHVRVGFEDDVQDFGHTQLAPSNAHLVERMAQAALKP
jgi:uncharacterized protein (DUF849 family)